MPEDTAESEFAGLLRELKDRSGHSYGTLAKRLHMSTSTLHRYCSGAVVPTDYAPVERLARLCRATPEELVALHRSWVLADTNRSRRSGDTDSAERAAATARDGAGPATAGTRAGAGAEAEAEAEAGTEAEAELTPPAAEESEQAADRVPAEALPADTADTADTTDTTGITGETDTTATVGTTETSGETAPTGRRRLRRAVLAGTAMVAVAAVAGALALSTDLLTRSADVRDSPVGAATLAPGGEQPRTDGPAAAPASPSGNPAGNPEDGPAGTHPAASPPGSAPAAPAAPGSAPDPGSASGTPVKVTTQPYSWETPCAQHYLIEKPPAQVGPPPVERDAPAWVAAAGAVSAGEQYVTVTLQGAGRETVVLDGLTVRTIGRRAPLAWNDYAMGYPGVGCGADVPTRSFTVALDAARPAVVPEADQRGFPYTVSESEPEVLHIRADTSAYDVSWYLELSWSSGSRRGTLRIDHNGKPFRTSGHNGRPGYVFPLGGDGWVRAGKAS
ncbi:helix-turn-helix domain-containing protein [Streptomyces sp. NPDC090046]|uniref:helix-turn-helix domain-containing protein n=1 Tax=Streptomyces sp. NPDC090046 TaxID=3365928 RepID=UPI0038029BC4